MFIPAIKGQGTDEQQKKWLPLAYKMQIIGCYAQTELGHGSNVQGLETTATFDPQTDKFVIHSPTLTSSKVRIIHYLLFRVLFLQNNSPFLTFWGVWCSKNMILFYARYTSYTACFACFSSMCYSEMAVFFILFFNLLLPPRLKWLY